MLDEVLERLYTIDHIPSHPLVKKKIESVLSNFDLESEMGLDILSKYISYDPSMTIEFLKIANSESFGFKSKISSIRKALLVLDNELIKLVITQHPVIPDIMQYNPKIDEFMVNLMKHSMEVQSIVQNTLDIALREKNIDMSVLEELQDASILHDIGMMFLILYFPDMFDELLETIQMGQSLRKKFGEKMIPEHAIIGSILCKIWNIPLSIRNSIAFHHYPWEVDESSLNEAEILYLADSISQTYYDIYYPENDLYTIEEHIIMKKNLLEIIEDYEIDITEIARIRQVSREQTEVLFSEIGF